MIKKREVKIAGDGEDIGDADLNKTASKVAAKGGVGGVNDGGGNNGVLDGANRAVGWATNDVVLGFASVE